ncbi:MAG TPA: hypothetical protein VNM87_09740 [Candidatus Udaeobacter sp.]|nr:hypothetical protein [Candidatus Udaeobacter sp.]
MIQATAGARPRLLAMIVSILALAALVPWLSEVQWRGEGVALVQAVRQGRPFAIPDRAGYLILGMAADTLFPGRTSLDLNMLGGLTAVLGILAMARFRSVLARGGVPLDRLTEPVATALALLSAGPWVLRAMSADPAGLEALLGGLAGALAWTGRMPQGMWVATLLAGISGRALGLVPIFLFAPRVRGDLKLALVPLALWIGVSLVLRPGFPHALDPAGPPALGDDLLRLGIGLVGMAPLAAVGVLVGLARGGPHRRFALALLAAAGLLGFLGRRLGLAESLVPLLPFLAVAAGGGVGSIRRLAGRWRRMALGPAALLLALCVLGAGLVTAYTQQVAPMWRRAREVRDGYRAMTSGLNRPYHFGGGWEDRRLLDLALGFALPPWEALGMRPIPDHVLTPIERSTLDGHVRRQDVLLLQCRGQAIPLPADVRGLAQIFKAGPAGENTAPYPTERELAVFGSQLVLEDVQTVLARGRSAGGLITFRVHWRADWRAGESPGGPLRVAMRIVDGGGQVRLDMSHWLANGFLDSAALGQRRFEELVVGYLPDNLEAGDYGVEIGIYHPLPGERAAHEMQLWGLRESALPVVSRGVPLGVTAKAVRAASFRLDSRAPLP